MKITPKGIGWLIFGVIVCASATEAYGIISALSTLALGFVFILIYVMKQFFKPRGGVRTASRMPPEGLYG